MIDFDIKYLEQVEEYLASGKLKEEFEEASENEKYQILDFLEKLMDLAELADEKATEIIFKGSQMELLAGVKSDT